MRGLYLDDGELRYRDDLPEPESGDGVTSVRVLRAGICATDVALSRGYMGFRGVPGHEFVGVALDGPLAGQRVVGEINAACGSCEWCARDLGRHCPNRSVLGILGHSGAFAERLTLPHENLHAVPDSIDDDAATFAEPVAAAFEIVEQLRLERFGRCLVAGDGKLGLLCAWVLHQQGLEVTIAGRHAARAELAPTPSRFLQHALEPDSTPLPREFDLAVEATGNPDVLPRLLAAVRPRGTVVLKTTTERPTSLDLAPLVVDEITLVGSRCGPFAPALAEIAAGSLPLDRLVDSTYGFEDGAEAMARAKTRGVLKVLLRP